MEVKKVLEQEKNRLIAEIMPKLDWGNETNLRVNDFLYLAEKQGLFSPGAYVFSDNEDILVELLAFSMGMSHLWYDYLEECPNAPYSDVNKLVLKFIHNMWGLERIERDGTSE